MNCLLHDVKYNLRLLERNIFRFDAYIKNPRLLVFSIVFKHVYFWLHVEMTSPPVNFNGRHRLLVHQGIVIDAVRDCYCLLRIVFLRSPGASDVDVGYVFGRKETDVVLRDNTLFTFEIFEQWLHYACESVFLFNTLVSVDVSRRVATTWRGVFCLEGIRDLLGRG